MAATELEQSITQLIEQTGALQSGHFQLASGLHASRFFRCIKLLRYPAAAQLLFDALADRFSAESVNYVLGANEAGSILAFEVAKRLGAEVAIARQKSDRYMLIEGFAFETGDRVLVVDDITTTGGTAKQLINIIRTAGAEPVGVGLIATKGLFTIDLSCRTEVLITLEGMDAIDPEECPLCQQGVAIG
ncbi:MAG: orotate phosphoribosyltransferase [Elainellaceae cyanobacterium]